MIPPKSQVMARDPREHRQQSCSKLPLPQDSHELVGRKVSIHRSPSTLGGSYLTLQYIPIQITDRTSQNAAPVATSPSLPPKRILLVHPPLLYREEAQAKMV